ncbi:hypothetical protein [Pseudomonas sp. CGJS7]|uniref:hypothetical protein n=1 Tax=Pseudomonas sp. CGJS7 TaxID=3109348 RepID=UPI00300B54A8
MATRALLAVAALTVLAALAPPAAAQRNQQIGLDCQSDPQRCMPENQMRYYQELRDSILQHWHPPSSVAADSFCALDLRQAPGGKLVSVQVAEPCDLDAAGRSLLLAAARDASPLPYTGYEQVFRPQLRLSLRAQEPDSAEDSRPKRWWRRLRER